MKTEKVLVFLQVLAWLGMFGYAVNTGSQLISFGVSCFNPEAAVHILGVSQSMQDLYAYDFRLYVFAMSFVVASSAMYTWLWLQVVKLLTKIRMKNPFTVEISKKLEWIAYLLVSIWGISLLGEIYTTWISKTAGLPLYIMKASGESLFNAGIVYIVSQIFKYGIELQEEQNLTI